jgi:hypothetical protein
MSTNVSLNYTAAWQSEYERGLLRAGVSAGGADKDHDEEEDGGDDEDERYWRAVTAKGEQTAPAALGTMKTSGGWRCGGGERSREPGGRGGGGGGGRKKQVDQFDVQERLVCRHLSMTDAAKSVGVHLPVMCNAIRDGVRLKDHTWKYVEAKKTQKAQAPSPCATSNSSVPSPQSDSILSSSSTPTKPRDGVNGISSAGTVPNGSGIYKGGSSGITATGSHFATPNSPPVAQPEGNKAEEGLEGPPPPADASCRIDDKSSVSEVANYVRGLSKLVCQFGKELADECALKLEREKISGYAFIRLSREELREDLKMVLGPRKILMEEIESLREKAEK